MDNLCYRCLCNSCELNTGDDSICGGGCNVLCCSDGDTRTLECENYKKVLDNSDN